MNEEEEILEYLKGLVEGLADIEHERWSRWMKHLFSKCLPSYNPMNAEPNGDLIIPKEFVWRWTRQMDTKYSDLSEEDKQKDREEVAHTLRFIEEYR